MERWFCAKTKPGQDRIAIENLARQDFEYYYPEITIERIRNKRLVREKEGLFPGYILIRFALDANKWRVINSTKGVYRLIIFGQNKYPSFVPDDQIEQIKKQEKAGKLINSEIMRLNPGDEIRINYGIYSNVTGQVIRTRGERVDFLLALLGRKIRCTAPSHALDLVSRASS